MYSNNHLLQEILDAEGEIQDSCTTLKFKHEKIESNFQTFREEIFKEKNIFNGLSFVLLLLYSFFIYKSIIIDDLIMQIIYSFFGCLDLFISIFCICHYKKNDLTSFIFYLLKFRIFFLFLINMLGMIYFTKFITNSELFFYSLSITILLKNSIFLILFDSWIKCFYIANVLMLCYINFIFFIFGDFKISDDILYLEILISLFVYFMRNRINYFLRHLYYENYKTKRLLEYNTQILEGLNTFDFIWYNKDMNYINNELKEFLINNRKTFMNEKEGLLDYSLNSNISNNDGIMMNGSEDYLSKLNIF